MNKYERNYNLNKLKEYRNDLINKAYSGDNDARYELFFSCTDRIDEVAHTLYVNIINIPNISYTLDDIKQVLYKDIWSLINRFYDRENKGYNLRMAISVRLRDLSIRINKYIENNNIDALEMLKNKSKIDNQEEFRIDRRVYEKKNEL